MITKATIGKPEQRALALLLRMHEHGMCVRSGGSYRAETFRKLEARGFVTAVLAVDCDDDGWTKQPERERWAWELTESGLAGARVLLSPPPTCPTCGAIKGERP